MRIVYVDDLPLPRPSRPTHRFIPTCAYLPPPQGGLDRVLSRHKSDVTLDPFAHVFRPHRRAGAQVEGVSKQPPVLGIAAFGPT